MLKQLMICQNCHTVMTPGKKTRSKVMEWTEYTCPECGSVWSDGQPLPGHEPVYHVPKAIEVEVTGPAKKKAKKKVPTAAAVEEVEVEESNGC